LTRGIVCLHIVCTVRVKVSVDVALLHDFAAHWAGDHADFFIVADRS
jgi:hypothetical protein